MARIVSALCLLLLAAGCASAAPQEREAYVLAHPHAWIELTISDRTVPDVPPPKDSGDSWHKPERCSISVQIDGEPWFSGVGYPQGEASPYAVSTGFRFPVAVGPRSITMSYGGCRVRDDAVATSVFSSEVAAMEFQVHELVFDGGSLTPQEPRADSRVSLEDIYEAITGVRSPEE